MLKWMVLYLPILWVATETAWSRNGADLEPSLLAVLIVLEILTAFGFVSFYIIYPNCLRQAKLAKIQGAAGKFWHVQRVSDDWTMTYTEMAILHPPKKLSWFMFFDRFTCKYEGETCRDTGLPHGLGRWLDDAWEGEMITGYWKQGRPVAPFSSWSYGTDDAVLAVRVAYFNATDDDYDKNRPNPSNAETSPTLGIASVECSVSGSFYNHLPEATVIEGPYMWDHFDPNETTGMLDTTDNVNPACYTNAIRQCIADLNPILQLGTNSNDKSRDVEAQQPKGATEIEIRATDPRGIQVVGHKYEPTGTFFAHDTNQITVEVVWPSSRMTSRNSDLARQSGFRFSRNMFLPRANSLTRVSSNDSSRPRRNTFFGGDKRPSLFGGKIVMVDIEESDNSDSDYSSDSKNDDDEDAVSPAVEVDEENRGETKDSEEDVIPTMPLMSNRSSNASPRRSGPALLRVQNWVPADQKEALIFLPGYNSCTKDRLQSFGQFLAMSKLSRRVYPFVFCWPGAVGPAALLAEQVAGNAKNFDNLHKLVASVHAAGIRTVHLMTHSMGVQCLVGALNDEYDEKGQRIGRSKLSRCFQLDHSFADDEEDEADSSHDRDHKLVCKTITLLNPDFPLEAFVDRGFLALRRICRTVTVVGDRNDRALYWSSVLNGLAARYGFQHPIGLQPELPPPTGRRYHRQERIGHSIDSLHFPIAKKDRNRSLSKSMVFQGQIHLLLGDNAEFADDTIQWLDLDVVDMTGLFIMFVGWLCRQSFCLFT